MSNARLQQLLVMREQNPSDTFLLFALAKEYERLQITDTAMDYFNKLEQLDPNYVGLYYHKGKLFEAIGNRELALDTYIKGIAVAQALQDKHALSELEQARWELSDDT